MFRRAFVPSFFDLYQLLVTLIGMIGVLRILCEYPWLVCLKYAAAIVAAFWLGQGLVALFQKPQTPKTSLD